MEKIYTIEIYRNGEKETHTGSFRELKAKFMAHLRYGHELDRSVSTTPPTVYHLIEELNRAEKAVLVERISKANPVNIYSLVIS